MSRTYRKNPIRRIYVMRSKYDFGEQHHIMNLEELKEYSKLPPDSLPIRTEKYKKVKLVDKKHGFVKSSDGTFNEPSYDSIEDIESCTQSGKKFIKRLKTKRNRIQSKKIIKCEE